jgi:beta-barrel assembly-enhancing protease
MNAWSRRTAVHRPGKRASLLSIRSAPAWLLLFAMSCTPSTQQEVELGTSYAQQINRQLPIVGDPEANRYINLLGDSLARVADDRSLQWRFYIVDSPEVNAFAVPGGFIYVNRGLIERTTAMNQLAGVLAHEIGHVTQRHSVKQMRDMQRADLGLTMACVLTGVCTNEAAGAAIQLGGSAVFAKFSRDDERQSDRVAVAYTVRAGIDPRGIPKMFEILLNERKGSPSGVDAWFRTHPLEESRIEEVQGEIAKLPASALRGLTVNTRSYDAFRSRLASLPRTTVRRGS